MRIVALLICLLVSASSYAVIETYEFSSDENQLRYKKFIDELRCPKCQNQNLSGSNSPIAKDLRRELYRLIEEGGDDKVITDFMVQRYGNFILYKPPVDKNTVLLWLFPIIAGILALLTAVLFKRKLANQYAKGPLTGEEQDKLQTLLEKY